MWGYGKSSFVDVNFYKEILALVKERLPDFQSHGLMSLMRLGVAPLERRGLRWCMKRLKWRDPQLNRGSP